MLVFPAEATHARLTWRLEQRHLDSFAVDSTSADLGLSGRDGLQCRVINRLHEAISQRIERGAQGADVFRRGYMLLSLWSDGPIVHNRAPGDTGGAIIDRDGRIHEITVCVPMSDAQLRELARSAAHWILMTLGAGTPVVHGTEPGAHIVKGFVNLLIQGVRIAGGFRDAVAGALGAGFLNERGSIKAGWRLRRWRRSPHPRYH